MQDFSVDLTADLRPGQKPGKRYHCAGCKRVMWCGADGRAHPTRCFDCREAMAATRRDGKRLCIECGDPVVRRRHRCTPCRNERRREQQRIGNIRWKHANPEKAREVARQNRKRDKYKADKKRFAQSKKGQANRKLYSKSEPGMAAIKRARVKYRTAHPEREKARVRNYQATHRPQIKEYWQKNRKKKATDDRRYYLKHRVRIAARMAESHRRKKAARDKLTT